MANTWTEELASSFAEMLELSSIMFCHMRMQSVWFSPGGSHTGKLSITWQLPHRFMLVGELSTLIIYPSGLTLIPKNGALQDWCVNEKTDTINQFTNRLNCISIIVRVLKYFQRNVTLYQAR